jgi:hypothetical protein
MNNSENNNRRKVSAVGIPPGIIIYMRKYFDEKDMTGIKQLKTKGQVCYTLDVTTEHNIYHLKFNSQGLLIEKVMEPLFEGILDETGVGD